MSEFRKKPVVVEATQWFQIGDHSENEVAMEANATSGEVVRYFRRPDVDGEKVCELCRRSSSSSSSSNQGRKMRDHGWIDTLEGGHIVCPGDFIITGIKGERYPCKPDIFAATYDAVDTVKPGEFDPKDRRWVTALALELPEAVYKDVRVYIDALYGALEGSQ